MSAVNLSLTHVVRMPETQAPETAGPPILILLHGLRSNEEDLFSLTPYLDERFLVLSVRAPLALGPGQYAWYRVDFKQDGIDRNAEDFERSRQLIARFIPEAVRAYGADPTRVYLMGFSQGAIMSVSIMLTAPQLLAGVVVMSGALPPEVIPIEASPESLQGFPVLVVHGLYDGVLPIAEGRQLRQHLLALPVRLDYHEYPMQHQISDQSLDDVCGWLIEQLNQKQAQIPPLQAKE